MEDVVRELMYENTLSSLLGISRIIPETYRITSIRQFAAGLSLLTLAIGLAPSGAHASCRQV
jgi:hypothetical protein